MKQYSDAEFWELLRTQEWVDIGSQLGLLQDLKGQLEVVQGYKGEYMKGFKGDVHLSALKEDVSSRLNDIEKRAVEVFGSRERFEELLFNMKIRFVALMSKSIIGAIHQKTVPLLPEEIRQAENFEKNGVKFVNDLMDIANVPKKSIFNNTSRN